MTSNRQQLSVREGTAPAVAQEGVPASLEPALRAWIWETVNLETEQAERIMRRLDLELPDSYWQRYQQELEKAEAEQARLDEQWEKARVAAEEKAKAKTPNSLTASIPTYVARQMAPELANPYAEYLADGTDTTVLWDVVDDLLYTFCIGPLPPGTTAYAMFKKRGAVKRTKKVTDSLTVLLEDSRSVYEVSPDQRGLQRRVDVVLDEAVDRAGQAADAAGYPQARLHLEKARRKLFERRPDPSGAYVEVILAVEAVACPMFLPNEQLPTLGKVLGRLRAETGKYEYALTTKQGTPGSIESVVAMIGSIWEGHSDRHAGGPLSDPVSRQAAMTAFTIATALVTIFSSGAVRRL